VPAPPAGVLSEIVIADGGTVVSDQVIAKIDSDGKSSPDLPERLPWRQRLVSSTCSLEFQVPIVLQVLQCLLRQRY
jgi:pyruvate/2-oxoglutarate dehydrogenase complex dihydrolipoamide acyltransferase (E2) component